MQVELIALREEESGGDKRGGGPGFMHRQELELAASSGTSCVIQGVFWAAKLHLQDGNRRNYRLQGKESRVRVYFSQDFLISPLCPIAWPYVHGASLLWRAGDAFLKIVLNRCKCKFNVSDVLYDSCCCWFLLGLCV